MKFLVTRTTQWNGEISPCPNDTRLVFEKFTRIDQRTIDDPNKNPYVKKEGWYEHGTNHRVVHGFITRDFPDGCSGWFIEINSLEELMKFYRQYGELILKQHSQNYDVAEIEIYDGYRE